MWIKRCRSQTGATALEVVVLVSCIALVALAGLPRLSSEVSETFGDARRAMGNEHPAAMPGGPPAAAEGEGP